MSAQGSSVSQLVLPPHSVEAEQGILGGLLLVNSAYDRVSGLIRADDFYRDDHRVIYRCIVGLIETGKPADVLTVAESLGTDSDRCGGLAYLGDLAHNTPSAANICRYAEIVHERAVLRRMLDVSSRIAALVYESGRALDDRLGEAAHLVDGLMDGEARQGDEERPVGDILPSVVGAIQDRYESDGALSGIPTGLADLDRMTDGLQRGDLVIVAARPSMGKTSLAMGFADHAAGAGNTVLVGSFEMSQSQLAMRMLSRAGRLDMQALRTGRMSDDDFTRISAACSRLQPLPVILLETYSPTVRSIRAAAKRVARRGRIDLLIVDYLQLMAGDGENRTQEIATISRGLKRLAIELNIPVVALSQLNRKVEERANRRPAMSDLRDCVAGDTLVLCTDGRRVPIRELVGQTPELWAIDAAGKVVAARSDAVWCVGRKPVMDVRLASGRILRATEKHRVLSGKGWLTIAELNIGDRVALVRGVPEPTVTKPWADHQVVLLGQLIGCWHQLVIAGNGNRWHPAGVGKWLKELGIFGQRAHEKHLPEEVFQLPDAQIGLLLRHLWATDGTIVVRKHGEKGASSVSYSTTSERLARDVAALLLRMGIVARIYKVIQRLYRPVFQVFVSGAEQQLRFLDKIGAFGRRVAPAQLLREVLEQTKPNTNVDTLPAEAFEEVKAVMRAQGISARKMASMRGTSYMGTAHFSFSPSRATIMDYAKRLGCARLARWGENDLFWDAVVAIEPAGEEEVYDLTVPGTASWLADGIVSHNSGSIEQDSDLILFIYRDEVYNADSPDKGTAEIIVAKHRNGPTGSVRVAYSSGCTRFDDLSRGWRPEHGREYSDGRFRE